MAVHKLCLLGGTGFVGRQLSARLSEAGHDIDILTRHRERQRELLVLPTVRLVEGDVHAAGFLRRQFEGKDTVINLVGILNEKGRSGKGFTRAHAELPEKIVQACRETGVPRLLHMSALHAARMAPSHYLRTKALGEEAVHRAENPDFHVTSFRPSVIFGPGDGFLNRFAGLLRLTPGVFPLACPDARFQPVYVEDVVRAFTESLDNHKTFGQRYDLCGPKVYTLREIVEYVAKLLGKRVCVVGLPDGLSYLQAAMLEFAPGKPFSLDNYRSLQIDSVCEKGFPEVFSITPTSLEEIAPGYLKK
ncbi:MAG: epimerase [Candidatus Muproteobacteria bacterium RIFCSPHIGHO2_12_FULL_60_33]|uniref:Epimerase n=1 Tax=Candidatus Muproteobacteria bacterium RIFCSPLOWO2_01_FULL_60_18 TaxID=1817768 RepID=A0A1F6TXJ1_9PROT|nr:MAG: epimerase [Candidatus Muproteobacteria bacterium RIFCSPHIGHO2_01_60_12]OGI49858.1 MAG: epimerase [Candidatus Muproteobacteria bacterium RIFCSPLOWO2_01_FULL_60_18]OGI53652.1 MAG: epimerase [Candidatus Muproteobacteria bacterium RIFCSPHIGHO2_12_FULL_60_33]OGI55228.1 MAG: epimerase [Candidatus Muproteobacteria bacterium RIFCSPHIGHO2_02_FULL_60_13]